MKQPDLTSSFTYRGKEVAVRWFDVTEKFKIPDLPWQQVYMIGNINGQAPIVHYDTGDNDNLPGGKVEGNEPIEDTIVRESREELNCFVLSWHPLGYQENRDPDGKIAYQFRVYTELQPLGAFEYDPGGSVVGYSLVQLENLNTYIHYGIVGERLIEIAKNITKYSK